MPPFQPIIDIVTQHPAARCDYFKPSSVSLSLCKRKIYSCIRDSIETDISIFVTFAVFVYTVIM